MKVLTEAEIEEIKATARAEALREAADRVKAKYATGLYGTCVEYIIEAILADKQEGNNDRT